MALSICLLFLILLYNKIYNNMDCDLGFIILRHVNSEETNKFWQHCYDCIRKFYSENSIIIIDDNSDSTFLTNNKILYKTDIIKSEFHRRGELLPYYYYLKNKFFNTACIIHDSVFIQKYIDMSIDKYKTIWEFGHEWDVDELEIGMLKVFEDDELIEFYKDKSLWNGCFGGMSIISHDYLSYVNDKYDFTKLLNVINTRDDRKCFERIIACLLHKNYKKNKSLMGSIYLLLPEGYSFCLKFKDKELFKDLPMLKIWNGR
uniref:Glycosyltransferase 2-like domain-containing protein n=1 Tax=viral metagenome TaxID=1070528 RepID=A0A6C0DJ03_9ZZZZ